MAEFNISDLETESDAIIQANDDNIYPMYYNSGAAATVKHKKATFKTLFKNAVGSDTAWTTETSLDNDWTGTIYYILRAGIVTVTGTLNGTAVSEASPLVLPAAYRPAVSQVTLCYDGASSSKYFNVLSNGTIQSGGTSATINFQITYPVL